MKKPVYEKCQCYPAMWCNPNACPHYEICLHDKIVKMCDVLRDVLIWCEFYEREDEI